jgi:hypothetical protein
MRGKNALVPMVEMMNNCSVFFLLYALLTLVSYLCFEFVGLHDQTLASNLWVVKSMTFS